MNVNQSIKSNDIQNMFIWLHRINIISYLNQLLGEHRHLHRSNSIQGTDYITNNFLNLRDFRTEIENLKWENRRDIIQVTFRKIVTLLVQKPKILGKNCL